MRTSDAPKPEPQPIVVSGRVRASGTMRRPGGPERCVVATSWATDRAFPRTQGEAVVFEVETEDGQRFTIDPRSAVVTVFVKGRENAQSGVPGGDLVVHETGWIAPGEAVIVEGDVESGTNGRAPRIRARRIASTEIAPRPLGKHCVPPRALARGRIEPEDTAGAGEPATRVAPAAKGDALTPSSSPASGLADAARDAAASSATDPVPPTAPRSRSRRKQGDPPARG